MDLTKLMTRVSDAQGEVLTFEQNQVVRRTHAALREDVTRVAADLRSWGVVAGMRIGIRAANCYEWVTYDLALLDVHAVCVSFTDDFATTDAEDLIRTYGLSLLVLDAHPREQSSSLKCIAYFGVDHSSVRVLEGQQIDEDSRFERPWMIFSSGSSGGLKGLNLNRAGVEDWVDAFAERASHREDDRILLFLPFSNFQQRPMFYAAIWYRLDVILTTPVGLFRALKEMKPTILIAPPTLYETFESRFSNSPRIRRTLGLAALRIANKVLWTAARRWVARSIFRQIHDVLGGRIRFLVTGMAPIKRSTLELFALMDLPLFETYGLVECGSIALNAPGVCRIGSVGKLLPGLQVTLAEDGEIIVRRTSPVGLGYFQSAPGENERTFLGDNCVATGDIGRFDADGFLYLIGRKKEMIITNGGEKVHPEVIEAQINACPQVERAVVFGDDGASALSAVVLLRRVGDAGEAAQVSEFVEEWNRQRPPIEIGNVIFTDIVFSRENGFLRPNLKLDRKRIQAHFRAGAMAETLGAHGD